MIDARPAFTQGDADALNARFEGVDTLSMLRVVFAERLLGNVAVVSSFGTESAVLLHLVAQADKTVPVIFVDTLKMFPETLEYRETLMQAFGFTDSRVVTPLEDVLAAKDANGLREFRRAPHSGRADLRALFAEGRGTASIAVAYTGSRDDRVFFTDQNFNFNTGRLELPGYWLMTVAASYKLQPNLEIYGRIENALDQKYQEVYGYNTAGIAAYAGVKITFDDLAGTAKK